MLNDFYKIGLQFKYYSNCMSIYSPIFQTCCAYSKKDKISVI